MAVNKVVMNTENGAETLIDLTADSVTPATLAAGVTAHDASGAIITGTATPVTLVQTTGESETAVMSQKAVTDALGKIELEKGERGTGMLVVTTAPASYTTVTNGYTPKYRIALSTVKTQSGVDEVFIGDTIRYSYYVYLVGYVDDTYAYMYTRTSIRGATGTSVTVKSVSESTEDGGSNVVTFSDNTTLAVKNGSRGTAGYTPRKDVDYFDGEDGYTPVKGVDYYTEEDKSEFSEYIATELAKRGQLAPEFANSVEECTDTSKMYVLPDGMIYAYMLTEVESGASYTNLADPTSSDWKANSRFSSSSGSISSCTGSIVTNTIAAKKGDIIRVKGLRNGTTTATTNSYVGLMGYSDAAGSTKAFAYPIYFDKTVSQHANGVKDLVTIENEAFVYPAFKVINASGETIEYGFSSSAISIRVGGEPVTTVDDIIITVNEEIVEGGGTTTGYAWASTGHAFVPADYEGRIIDLEETTAEHTAKITALEKAVETGGTDESETAALTRIKNWKYPIHEDAPVFLLETDKPAIPSTDWNTEAVYAKYDALMAANSHYITKVNCGMASDDTTPIYVYHFKEAEPHYNGNNWSETKPVILVVSGVHPTEQSGVWSMYYAMEEITNNAKLRDLRRNVHFIVMPMINPTAFTDSTYGVRNPDGIQVHYNFEVDFKYPTDSGYVAHGNRNHGGETPLSIPETQYFDAIMDEYKDTLACVLSCHNNDVDTQWGTGYVWCSCATHFMCNLGFRFIDKMSAAWREKHGTAFDEGVRWANNYALTKKAEGSSTFPNAVEQPEWDFRIGRASISGSGGTEYKQALKYGVHGINVEVCDRCMVIDKDYTKTRTAAVTTMGAETYINFFRTFMAAYDPHDKKDYAPNLPWSE